MSRAKRVVIVLLTLAGFAGLLRFVPVRAQTQPALPPEINATLMLGATTTRTFTIHNTETMPLTVTLYEAYSSSGAPEPVTAPTHGAGPERALFASPQPRTAGYLVYLRDNADLSHAYSVADWRERGNVVYQRLTEHAARSQARLQAELARRGYPFHSYWIVNAIAVEGDDQLAGWLARQPEVALVSENHAYERVLPQPEPENGSLAPGVTGWHLDRTGATTVWRDFGVEGTGITVASIDSGVLWNHTALRGNYRGSRIGSVEHAYNWADMAGTPPSDSPVDPLGHGTHVMGIMAGRRGSDIVQSGVAPRAKWMAVRGCGEHFCLEQDMLEAAQWLIAPTDLEGNDPRPDLRPHIIVNSWGFNAGGSGWFEGALSAWRAAGMFAPFAAGNAGPSCGTIDSPALSGNAFAVGGTGRDDEAAAFSARGPTYDGRVKPDLVAPGAGIYAPYKDGRFVALSGTSMAAPIVAGAAALLWSANPALIGDVAATEKILRQSADPLYAEECGSKETDLPNNVYGTGRLNIAEAVRLSRVDVTWFDVPGQLVIQPGQSADVTVIFDASRVTETGTYHARIAVARGANLEHTAVRMVVVESPGAVEAAGRVVDRDTGTGVLATVQFENGLTLHSLPDGTFGAQVPRGQHTMTVSAAGYQPNVFTATITDATFLSVTVMADMPRIDLEPFQAPLEVELGWGETVGTTVFVRNTGSQPLVITPTIPADEWQRFPLGFTAPHPLERFEVLRLGNDEVFTEGVELPFQVPLFGRQVTRVYPSSNGWLATARTTDSHRTVRCLPSGFAYGGMLAPFWADLDPSQGGTIKVGTVDPDTFVISYEGLPARAIEGSSPATQYTFQVVFRRDGAIEFRYGQMGELPPRWTVGMSATPERAQMVACDEDPVFLSYRGWRFLNQTSPRDWTLVDNESALAISPGDAAEITVGFRGNSPAPWLDGPMRARVRLLTNDPRHPVVDVRTVVTIGPAPYHHWLGFGGHEALWNRP